VRLRGFAAAAAPDTEKEKTEGSDESLVKQGQRELGLAGVPLRDLRGKRGRTSHGRRDQHRMT
jgi:hypothetical protein